MVSKKFCAPKDGENPRGGDNPRVNPRGGDGDNPRVNPHSGERAGTINDKNAEKKKPVKREAAEYTPEVCEKLLAFFTYPKQRIVYDIEYFQGGEPKRKKPVPLEPEYPTLDRFARQIGVMLPTLYQWEKQYPEFAEACAAAREVQKSCVIVNALNRNFDAGFSKFLLCKKFPEEFSEESDLPDGAGLDIHITYGKESGQ